MTSPPSHWPDKAMGLAVTWSLSLPCCCISPPSSSWRASARAGRHGHCRPARLCGLVGLSISEVAVVTNDLEMERTVVSVSSNRQRVLTHSLIVCRLLEGSRYSRKQYTARL